MSAKNYLFFFILAIGALSACKKNKKDNITFHEFSPNVEVNNIDSFAIAFPAPGCLPGIPCPGGVVATYELDIDSDDQADFKIEVKHSPNPNGFSTLYPCSNYISDMNIISLYSENKVTRLLSENDAIDEDYNGWTPRMNIVGYNNSTALNGTRYIGFQLKRGKRYNYGWLKLMKIPDNTNKHGLILLSYAYNNTTDKRILAGQQK